MAISSKVETVGDFSFIRLEGNHGLMAPDVGVLEENWCQWDILKQLDEFKKANPDKKILSFQVDKYKYKNVRNYISGIYIHHELIMTKIG